MAAMNERASVTNEQVAKDLGITHSMVSRIRSGNRLPSIHLMRKIDSVLGFRIVQQIAAAGNYAEAFENALGGHYADAADAHTTQTGGA